MCPHLNQPLSTEFQGKMKLYLTLLVIGAVSVMHSQAASLHRDSPGYDDFNAGSSSAIQERTVILPNPLSFMPFMRGLSTFFSFFANDLNVGTAAVPAAIATVTRMLGA